MRGVSGASGASSGVCAADSVTHQSRASAGAFGFGSFIVQTHIALGPFVACLALWALACVLMANRRQPDRSAWPIVNASAWLLIVLWLPPIAEQLSHRPGNFVQL